MSRRITGEHPPLISLLRQHLAFDLGQIGYGGGFVAAGVARELDRQPLGRFRLHQAEDVGHFAWRAPTATPTADLDRDRRRRRPALPPRSRVPRALALLPSSLPAWARRASIR